LKRYDAYAVEEWGDPAIDWEEDARGDWVRYEDHAAECDRLREALAELTGSESAWAFRARDAETNLGKALDERYEARAERDRLREALRKREIEIFDAWLAAASKAGERMGNNEIVDTAYRIRREGETKLRALLAGKGASDGE